MAAKGCIPVHAGSLYVPNITPQYCLVSVVSWPAILRACIAEAAFLSISIAMLMALLTQLIIWMQALPHAAILTFRRKASMSRSARDNMCLCRGLLYCMEYLEENLDDWLGEELEVRSTSSLRVQHHGTLHTCLSKRQLHVLSNPGKTVASRSAA